MKTDIATSEDDKIPWPLKLMFCLIGAICFPLGIFFALGELISISEKMDDIIKRMESKNEA